MRHLAAGIAALWLGAVVLMAQAPPAARNPVPPTVTSIAAGKQAYTRNCAPCHGTSAEGGPGNDLIPAAPDLTDATWDRGSTDGEIFSNIRNGVAPEFNMTPFKDKLTDEEIWNVVNYVRSLAKKSSWIRPEPWVAESSSKL